MSFNFRFATALLVGLALSSAQARAADITFELSQIAFGNPTSSLTSGGYTLLFTGIGGNLSGNTDTNWGGIAVDPTMTFSIQKTAGAEDLVFKSYELGYAFYETPGVQSFNLSGGTGTSNGNSLPASNLNPSVPVSFNFQGPYAMVGTQTVQFNPVNFSATYPDGVMFHSLTFTPSIVPEPSTYILGGLATGVMAFVARRRKASRQG